MSQSLVTPSDLRGWGTPDRWEETQDTEGPLEGRAALTALVLSIKHVSCLQPQQALNRSPSAPSPQGPSWAPAPTSSPGRALHRGPRGQEEAPEAKTRPCFFPGPSSSTGLPLCTPGGGWISSLHTRPGTVPKVPLPSLEQWESLGKARLL